MSCRRSNMIALCAALFAYERGAHACSACFESSIHLGIPFMVPAIMLLGVWRIAYAILQRRAAPSSRPFWGKFGLRALAVGFASLFLLRAALLLYLLGSFAKALLRLWRNPHLNSSILPARRLLLLHLSTLIVFAPLVIYSYVVLAKSDPIERVCRYTLPGTGPARILLREFATDPAADVSRLAPLLESADERDRDIAWHALSIRKSRADLDRFAEVTLARPELESALGERWTVREMYLRDWLHSVGVDDTVRTRDDLKRWMTLNPSNPIASPSKSG